MRVIRTFTSDNNGNAIEWKWKSISKAQKRPELCIEIESFYIQHSKNGWCSVCMIVTLRWSLFFNWMEIWIEAFISSGIMSVILKCKWFNLGGNLRNGFHYTGEFDGVWTGYVKKTHFFAVRWAFFQMINKQKHSKWSDFVFKSKGNVNNTQRNGNRVARGWES